MNVLVTGATGFLGSELARQLCRRGDDVRVLVRAASDRRRLDGLAVAEVVGDVTDRESVARGLEGVELVHHVAAHYEIGTRDPEAMRRINVDGTANVLEEAAARGIPSVYVSSVAAQGPTGTRPEDETYWAPRPAPSVYGETKRAAHEVFKRLAEEGASVRAAMPVTIYGPDDPSLIGTIHSWFARGLMPIGTIRDNVVSWVHVADCAAGLIAIADAGRDGDGYVLSAQAVPVGEWFEVLAEAAGRRKPVAYVPFGLVEGALRVARPVASVLRLPRELLDEGPAMVTSNFAYSGEKARRELGWQPRSLREGMADTMAWYRLQRT